MAEGDETNNFDDLWQKLPDPPAKVSATNSVPVAGSRRALREQNTAAAQRGRVGLRPADLPESGLGSLTTSALPTADAENPFVGGAPVAARPQVSAQPVAHAVAAAETVVAPQIPTQNVATAARVAARPSETFLEEMVVPQKQVEPKKKHGRGPIVWLVILALVGAGLYYGGKLVWDTFGEPLAGLFAPGDEEEESPDYEAGIANGEAVVTITEGASWAMASRAFHEAGVTKTDRVLYDYVRVEQPNAVLQPGIFAMQKQMTAEAAFNAMMDANNQLNSTFELFPGDTQADVFRKLEIISGIPAADFHALSQNPEAFGVPRLPDAPDNTSWLEGWLGTGTYRLLPDDTAETILQQMVARQKQVLADNGVPEDRVNQILTIASIISREGHYSDEYNDYYEVSDVIWNRTVWNEQTYGFLQMDSTAMYGVGELHDGTLFLSARAKDDDNPWNTYVHTGLPIGPISNPGPTAINAAMNPSGAGYLFFTLVNPLTGETKFASNLYDHERNVAELEQWLADNPDYSWD